MEPDSEVFEYLKQSGKFFEIYRVHNFVGYRYTQAGKEKLVQEVNVEILDAGENAHPRYHVSATAGDKKAHGNSNDSLEAAIAVVHWWDLDK